MGVYLAIAGADVDSYAWGCENKADPIDASPEQEGDNLRLPEQNGAQAYETFDGETTIDLRWWITGNVHPDTGDRYSSPSVGLAENKRLFRERYFRATRDADGCVSCEGTDAAGNNVANPIQVMAPKFGEGEYETGVVMTIRIPAGELADAGS